MAFLKHVKPLLSIMECENINDKMLSSLLSIIEAGSAYSKFKKEAVKAGVCEILVSNAVNGDKLAVSCLMAICRYPNKSVYIPGETSDHKWVRNKVLTEGILVQLLGLLEG